MTGWLKILGPVGLALALLAAGVYLGNIKSRANDADRAETERDAARASLADQVKATKAANTARANIEVMIARMEIELDAAHRARIAPKAVRAVVPDGSACLGADAVGVLNSAIAAGNGAVRTAAE